MGNCHITELSGRMVIVRKIVFALCTSSILFVCTSIYAQSTANISLLDWHNRQFQWLVGQVSNEVQIELVSLEASIENRKEQSLVGIGKGIGEIVLSTSRTATADIEKYKEEYMTRLAETEELLLEQELLDIEQEMIMTEKEIENSAFAILEELLREESSEDTTKQ